MTFMKNMSQFCHGVQFENLPPKVIENAKKAIIDTHGVMLSGYNEPVSNILVEWVRQQSTNSRSTVLGYGFKTSENLSALLNGAMGHAIDYDDVISELRGHPSLPVYAAVLAVCEAENKTGKDVITAFAVGVEVISKLGSYMNPSHAVNGWHSTATLGVVAVAAAIGKLYDFDEDKFKKVFGLASSMMSGLKINFGTMTKPFHVGYCARNGIEAAQLVNSGFTACEDSFTPETGVFDLYTDQEMKDEWGANLGNPWSIVEPGINIKRYPCCYATHRFADAAHHLNESHTFNPNEIMKIECVAGLGLFAPVIHNRPKTGLQGKFSVEYVVAAMLVDKQVTIKTFTDENVNRAVIQNLIPKVELIEDDTILEDRSVNNTGYVELTISTGQKTFKEKVYHAKGSSKNPIDINEVKDKFVDCFSTLGYSSGDNELYSALLHLEAVVDLNHIVELTSKHKISHM